MKRASRKNGIVVPGRAKRVSCVHNGPRQPCFAKSTRKAHPECISFTCSVCGMDYSAADTHEPRFTAAINQYGNPAEPKADCFHVPAIEKNAAKIDTTSELSDLASMEDLLKKL